VEAVTVAAATVEVGTGVGMVGGAAVVGVMVVWALTEVGASSPQMVPVAAAAVAGVVVAMAGVAMAGAREAHGAREVEGKVEEAKEEV
jgi:hypothetical protein